MLLRTHSMLPMPTAPMPVNVPMNALLDWLGAHGIAYDLHEHPLAFTALEAAQAEGLDPHVFAKTLAVGRSDGRRALIAIEASDHLDLEAAARLLDTDRIRLLTEFELLDLAPTLRCRCPAADRRPVRCPRLRRRRAARRRAHHLPRGLAPTRRAARPPGLGTIGQDPLRAHRHDVRPAGGGAHGVDLVLTSA